jgi:hypothetical protein
VSPKKCILEEHGHPAKAKRCVLAAIKKDAALQKLVRLMLGFNPVKFLVCELDKHNRKKGTR